MRRDCFIGVMSGTSLDGIDAVIADFDGGACTVVGAKFQAFAASLRQELLQLQSPGADGARMHIQVQPLVLLIKEH